MRTAVVAGITMAMVVIAIFCGRPVPDRMVSLLGGPSGGVDRLGGVRIRYRPAPGVGEAELERSVGANVRRDGDTLVLEFPRVAEDMLEQLSDVLVGGGLEMREALETTLARDMIQFAADGVELEEDMWQPEDGGPRHQVPYLRATSRAALERTITEAASHGVRPAPGVELMVEHVDGHDRRPPEWRLYELAPEVLIDGAMIDSASVSYDPNTNRPIVLLSFTREGGDRFCDVTGRLAGHKFATVLGGTIRSVPVINGRICGGRASITMGGSDPVKGEREAHVLAAVLSQGTLPPGGSIESARWQPAANVALQEWLGRVLFGLFAGLGFGALVALALRFAKPSWRTTPASTGPFPWRRFAVTALAPVTLLVGSQLLLPGINDVELVHVTRDGDTTQASVLALGIMPLLTSFAIVELIALAVPRLRWRRHDPIGRVRLGQAVALVAILVALLQGYFIASYFEAASRGGAEIVMRPGTGFRLLTMVTLATGTMMLAVVAGMISVHGLGNGYGALLVSGWLLGIVRPLIDQPSGMVSDLIDEPSALAIWLTRERVIGLVVLVAMMVFTWALLRWRIRGGDREPAYRMPSSSLAPLSDAGGLIYLIGGLSALGLGAHFLDAMTWVGRVRASTIVYFAVVIGFVPVWGWLLARPALLERVALQAGLSPPSRCVWARATLLSGFALATLAVLGFVMTGSLAEPVMAMIATAVLLDVIDDARAHRELLAPAGVLHQIQRAGVVERVLADAGIRCYIHASNLRALYAFFGPWAPAVVLVPKPDAARARELVDGALREARTKLPRAELRDEAV